MPAQNQNSDDRFSLDGKRVVISGGTTGIGRAAAKLLSQHGAKVLIFGRHERELSEALKDIPGAMGVVADQSKLEDIRRVFADVDQKLGGIDVMINNAAIGGDALAEITPEETRYVLETNVLGYMVCTREALVRMKQRGGGDMGGHIINIGSMSADLREEEGEVYSATKAAIQAFSESLRKTANKDGIKITLIEPGAVATPIQEKTPQEEQDRITDCRMLTADDIAECIHFCLNQPKRTDIVQMQVRPLRQFI